MKPALVALGFVIGAITAHAITAHNSRADVDWHREGERVCAQRLHACLYEPHPWTGKINCDHP